MTKPPKAKEPLQRPRMVPRHGGQPRIVRVGHKRMIFRDLYVTLLEMPWLELFFFSTVLYLLSNLVFAAVYYATPAGIANAHGFADYFFFSVQTMATIGYGRMTPIGDLANFVVTLEALWGFTFFAFIAGLVFAKFSRPTAHVLFSDVAVISNFEGQPHLKIRLANQRTNRIVDAVVTLYLMRNVRTREGYPIRRFYDLRLTRDHVPLLQLTWTLFHPIDTESPLFGLTQEQMREQGDEIILALSGVDETLSQPIHARHSYIADEIIFDAFFEDVVSSEAGRVTVDYTRFHTIRRVLDSEGGPAATG